MNVRNNALVDHNPIKNRCFFGNFEINTLFVNDFNFVIFVINTKI